MSRSLLLASFLSLPLLATACTETPEPPPADLRFDGPGVYDDGVWYLPGHADTLIARSTDERRPAWTFVGTGRFSLDATMHGESGSSTVLRATEPDEGTVSLVDLDGNVMGELPVHVTYPDRVLLVGEVAGDLYIVGDEIRILAGDRADFGVSYAHGQRTLAGHGLLEGDNNVGVSIGDRGDSIRLAADAGPYRSWMNAGPDASRVVDVVPTAAADVQFRLTADETAAAAGDTVYVRKSLRMREGDEPVFHGRETWLRDGAEVPPIWWYRHDPSAPATTIEVRLGVPGQQVTATAVIHAAP